MEILDNIAALRSRVAAWRRSGERIAFVPTMGNLHQGHLELVRQAQVQAQHVIVSIFINPLQFGYNEDFLTYPRTIEADQQILATTATEVLFTPSVAELYPDGQETQTRVEVPKLSNILCGARRPNHFSGVTTIVCKLFNLVQPDLAVFGEKDFQQLLIIRRMVADLNLPIEIIGVATVREPDGLAMSSRNNYLNAEERAKAPALYRALQTAAQGLQQGLPSLRVETRAHQDLRGAGLRADYVSVRRAASLAEVSQNDQALVVLAAAYLGRTRLIDNIRVPQTPSQERGAA